MVVGMLTEALDGVGNVLDVDGTPRLVVGGVGRVGTIPLEIDLLGSLLTVGIRVGVLDRELVLLRMVLGSLVMDLALDDIVEA